MHSLQLREVNCKKRMQNFFSSQVRETRKEKKSLQVLNCKDFFTPKSSIFFSLQLEVTFQRSTKFQKTFDFWTF